MHILGLTVCALICTFGTLTKADSLLNLAIRSATPKGPAAGHYWRDFDGRIPDDAYPVTEQVFIGQVLTHKVLVPTQVDGKKKLAIFTYEGVPYTVDNYYKILCTDDTTRFKFVQTDNDAIKKLLPTTTFVEGGADDGYPLFIGKPMQGDYVGKVTIYYRWAGLAYVVDGMHKHDNAFQVMVYK